MKREFIGHVVIDEDRSVVYFERILAPAESRSNTPYENDELLINSRKRIHVASLDASFAPRPLFPQDDGAGYFFAGEDPWSPTGRYLSIYRLDGVQQKPSVFDLDRGQFKTFELTSEVNPAAPRMTWVSEYAFVDFNLDAPRRVGWDTLAGIRTEAAMREAAWLGEAVTADVSGSGAFRTFPDEDSASLQEVDVRTGEITFLLRGPVSRVTITPDGPVMGVYERTLAGDPAFMNAGNGSHINLSFLNVRTGERTRLKAAAGERDTLLYWSVSGRYAVVERKTKVVDGSEQRHHTIYDAIGAEAVTVLPDGVESFAWVGDRLAFSRDTDAIENGTVPMRDALAFEMIDADLLAASNGAVFYLDNGDVWRADFDGRRERLTDAFAPPIERLAVRYPSSPMAARPFRAMSRMAHERMLSFDQIPLTAKIDGVTNVIVFSSDGTSMSVIKVPNDNAELVAVSQDGAAFVSNDPETGGNLVYVVAGFEGESRSVLQFNEHIARLTPASEPIPITHKGYDGQTVTSWLYLPPGVASDSQEKYPLVMVPYSGSVYAEPPNGWDASDLLRLNPYRPTAIEVFAAYGYAVVIPSIPLGESPSEPMSEMMPAILGALDAAIATGLIDEDRLALIGHSYGGYTAYSVAVQTNRFDAIIAAAGIGNLSAMYGVFSARMKVGANRTDPPGGVSFGWFERDGGQGRMGSPPWDDPERYLRNSPFFFADRIETPLMMIHGDLDGAGSIEQPEQMLSAMRRLGKDALFVRYVGEGHTINHSQNQHDMWKRILVFLEETGVTPGPEFASE